MQWDLQPGPLISHSRPLCLQVSHHPPVSAFHVSNRKDGFCLSGSVTARSRFYGERLGVRGGTRDAPPPGQPGTPWGTHLSVWEHTA